MGGFLPDVQGFRGRHLHMVGQFVAFDSSREIRFVRQSIREPFIELPEKIELCSLSMGFDSREALEVVDGFSFGLEPGALVDAGEESSAPV